MISFKNFVSICLIIAGFYYSAVEGIQCYSNPCGINTSCQNVTGRPVCSCLPGYFGNPLTRCQKGECIDNSECPSNKACVNNYCVANCANICGVGAECDIRNHVPVCRCPPGYIGDPFTRCRRFDPQELCSPNPCGKNTKCSVVKDVPTCSCLPGFHGSAIKGCVPECELDSDCLGHQRCDGYKCKSLCGSTTCGENANCEAKNHIATCTCPENYIGNPLVSCRPECTYNGDCPGDNPVCWYGKCLNPCKGVCGLNANCEVQGAKAICSCPRDMTGDPFKFCRPFEKYDLCNPNPCGSNAICTPGKDKYNEDRPVCTCPPGYIGNALAYCQRGECSSDDECSQDKMCDQQTYTCVNPCRNQCGSGAECVARQHQALCACPAGYTGNAIVSCSPLSTESRRRSFFFY